MQPHPKLIPLLEKQHITWEVFSKRGRPAPGVREARVAIVTELHAAGTSWAEMMKITGMSNGGIQRLTEAMWNPASRKKMQEGMRKVGSSWKGKKRTGQLNRQWAKGDFDGLKGRKRPDHERAKLKAAWTPERKEAASKHSKKLWANVDIRKRLLAFHQNPEERVKRSCNQALRMLITPAKFVRGRAQWVTTIKEVRPLIRVRSSYEAAAVKKLDADAEVLAFEYETPFRLEDGHLILPDFIIHKTNGQHVLIEVKAAWTSNLPPEHSVQKRLLKAKELARSRGWGFAVWTEKELGDALTKR